MDDATHQRIDDLEQRIDELAHELDRTRKQLTEAQVDQWKGRIDDIEVQLGLAKLETQQQLAPVLEQLRNGLLDVQEQLGRTTSVASDAFSSLRSGVESAVDDLRSALRDARRTVADDD